MTRLIDEIADLVARTADAPRERVNASTRLFSDLGMDGDDAHDVMQAFCARYPVDMSTFHWRRYFGDEGWSMGQPAVVLVLQAASRSFRERWATAERAEREITVAHLARVAEAGHWFEPDEPMTPRVRWIGVVIGVFGATPAVAFLLFSAVLIGEGVVSRSPTPLLIGAALALFPALVFGTAWLSIQRKLASAP